MDLPAELQDEQTAILLLRDEAERLPVDAQANFLAMLASREVALCEKVQEFTDFHREQEVRAKIGEHTAALIALQEELGSLIFRRSDSKTGNEGKAAQGFMTLRDFQALEAADKTAVVNKKTTGKTCAQSSIDKASLIQHMRSGLHAPILQSQKALPNEVLQENDMKDMYGAATDPSAEQRKFKNAAVPQQTTRTLPDMFQKLASERMALKGPVEKKAKSERKQSGAESQDSQKRSAYTIAVAHASIPEATSRTELTLAKQESENIMVRAPVQEASAFKEHSSFKCCVCSEDVNSSSAHLVPGCRHRACVSCVSKTYRSALESETAWPVKACCNGNMPLEGDILDSLSQDLRERVTDKSMDWKNARAESCFDQLWRDLMPSGKGK